MYEWTIETVHMKEVTQIIHTCPMCGCKVVSIKKPLAIPQETVRACMHPDAERNVNVSEGAMFKRLLDYHKYLKEGEK